MAALKKWVETKRSEISMLVTSITAGRPKMVMNEATSTAHKNSGIRARVMPGGRILRMVATRFTETARAATSVKVIIWAQMSTRWPEP